eukprot:scaffold1704_cov246-Pinguiococcus_pyrenoidosus.AAC.6
MHNPRRKTCATALGSFKTPCFERVSQQRSEPEELCPLRCAHAPSPDLGAAGLRRPGDSASFLAARRGESAQNGSAESSKPGLEKGKRVSRYSISRYLWSLEYHQLARDMAQLRSDKLRASSTLYLLVVMASQRGLLKSDHPTTIDISPPFFEMLYGWKKAKTEAITSSLGHASCSTDCWTAQADGQLRGWIVSLRNVLHGCPGFRHRTICLSFPTPIEDTSELYLLFNIVVQWFPGCVIALAYRARLRPTVNRVVQSRRISG